MYFDADTHVDECADTWSYLPSSMIDMKPVPMLFENGEEPGYVNSREVKYQRGLCIDGQLFRREVRSDEFTGTTEATRELHDVPARLRDMDKLGVDTQVIYPTGLMIEVTRRPELEVALCQSYNRWLADRCSESNDRLRWVALLPYRSMPDAIVEMRWAKEHGAIGILKRGYECDERRANDPYFFPVYAEAQDLDLPICIHIAAPYTGMSQTLTKLQTIPAANFYLHDAFLCLLKDRIYDRFPSLRFGFIEAAAAWVPHVVWLAGFDSAVRRDRPGADLTRDRELFSRFLADSRIFVSCEVSEDIPGLIDVMGDDAFLVGSDYTHNDRASIQGAHGLIADIAGISASSAAKLTSDNARRFYGLA